MTTEVHYDCQACGACCVAPCHHDTYVDLLPSDVVRLPAHYRRKHVRGDTDWASLSTKENHSGHQVCVALLGTVGKRVKCGIYESRPLICRQFKPGSRQCLEARSELRDLDPPVFKVVSHG